MSGQLMRGAAYARNFLSAYLATEYPPLLATARTEWSLQEWQLPTPLKYDCYDPLTMHVYPSIGSLVRGTGQWKRNDMIAGEEVYSARYRMMLFIWVKTPIDPEGVVADDAYAETLALRDDMLGLMRSCILTKPSLNSQGNVEVDEATMAEDYLDAIKQSNESPTWFAGGTITFDMRVSEQNRHNPVGTADQFGLDIGNTAPTQPME